MKHNNLFKFLAAFFLGASVGLLCAGLVTLNETLDTGSVLLACALICVALFVGMMIIQRSKEINQSKLDELDVMLRDTYGESDAGLLELSEALKRLAEGDRTVRVSKASDRLCTITEQINALAEALEAAEREQNTFISTVAHDLRSPMASVIGFVDAMLDGTVPTEDHERYLTIVSAECKRLALLVSDLLDISRIRSGSTKLSLEACDVCEIARTVLISLGDDIDKKALDVSFNCGKHNMAVVADAKALHRVIFNLLDNAVKYSRKGARLAISVTESHDNIKVEIFNEGQGVRPEELESILEPFYRTDDGRACFKGGSGLGMYICRMILKQHGSELAVESLYGEWFKASFALPCTDLM